MDKLLGIRENATKSTPHGLETSAKNSQGDLQSRFNSKNADQRSALYDDPSTVHEADRPSKILPLIDQEEPILTFRGSLQTFMPTTADRSRPGTNTIASRVGMHYKNIIPNVPDETTRAHVKELQEFHDQASSREPTQNRRAIMTSCSPRDSQRY